MARLRRRNGWRIVTPLVPLLLLVGCSSAPATQPDAEWCAGTWAELDRAGVGWPVANRPLDATQLDAIRTIFSRAAVRAGGNLRVAATAWTEGYVAALPYLRTGDEGAFERNVAPELREQFQLANIALTNICQWFDRNEGRPA